MSNSENHDYFGEQIKLQTNWEKFAEKVQIMKKKLKELSNKLKLSKNNCPIM